MSEVRLAVGIPHTGSLKADTARGLISLVGELRGTITLNFLFHGGCYVHKNRETLVKQALELNYTHLLFIDTDMIWHPGSVERLLSLKKPIIGADYHERRLPLRSTIKVADKNGKLKAIPKEKFPKKPFKCWAIPTGFMLIDLSIMKKIPKPWFFFELEDGEFAMGEDIWFCRQATKAGIDIWCDPEIEVGHIGEFVY